MSVETALIIHWHGRARPTVGSSFPWAGILGCLRKPVKHESRSESANCVLPWFRLQFLPRFPRWAPSCCPVLSIAFRNSAAISHLWVLWVSFYRLWAPGPQETPLQFGLPCTLCRSWLRLGTYCMQVKEWEKPLGGHSCHRALIVRVIKIGRVARIMDIRIEPTKSSTAWKIGPNMQRKKNEKNPMRRD